MANRDDIKQRIHRGDVLIGVSAPVTASKSQLEDILGKDDYAFVSSDSQHSAFNEETLVRFCSYVDELDMPVQFRIKHTYHSYLIGNVLDLGPAGIEVPQVEEPVNRGRSPEVFLLSPAREAQLGRRGAVEN